MEEKKNRQGRAVSPQRKQEIEKEKDKLREKLKDVDINKVMAESVMSDRDYSREHKKIYKGVRKGLVLIQKKKSVGLFNNEECVKADKELLTQFLNL